MSDLTELPTLWREACANLQAGVKDSPSHDLKRLIKERCEAFTICADELEHVLARATPNPNQAGGGDAG